MQGFPWATPKPTLQTTQRDYCVFQTIPNAPGAFVTPGSLVAADSATPPAAPYNDPAQVARYAVMRPLACGPANWAQSEYPAAALLTLQAEVYARADWYSRTYCGGVALAAGADQVKVACILAALRDKLLVNFTTPPNSPSADAAFAPLLNAYHGNTYTMAELLHAAIANHYPGTTQIGFKVQCTQTAPILTHFLNGYGIPARQWGVSFVTPNPAGRSVVRIGPQDVQADVAAQHGTVEYWDSQYGKWVAVDLIYGNAAFISPNLPGGGSNVAGAIGVPLSLAELVFHLANGIAHTTIWTRRNYVAANGEWYRARPSSETSLARYDPNGNVALKATFLSTTTPYSMYQTWAAA